MTGESFRRGFHVTPVERISLEQVLSIHEASMCILDDPGIACFNEEAAGLFNDNGCRVKRDQAAGYWHIRIPESVVLESVEKAPSRVILGARDPANVLVLDTDVPRVYFGTGSETNVFLETTMDTFQSQSDAARTATLPVFHERRGSLQALCDSARLCNSLEHIDFFIRNVNIQDEGIESGNKDVNVFLASLLYMNKHVQAGLTDINALDDVLRMAEIIAGDPETFKSSPLISFIACLVKSPLQMVDDTTQKVIAIARRGLPMVISSSPQGGSTAPIQEEGMVALINAEILSGVTLSQIVNPGTPVLYGAVPVRARLDTLHDLYGAPEFIHYNLDCVQMARHYHIPCYSTAGVGDAKVPGIQATVEKLFSHLSVAASGAQYIHYAFGLLNRTNTFCPVQAIIDNASVELVRHILRQPAFKPADTSKAVTEIRKVVSSETGLFARYIRKYLRRGVVARPFRFGTEGFFDETIARAHEQLAEIRGGSAQPVLDDTTLQAIHRDIPGLLDLSRFYPYTLNSEVQDHEHAATL